MALIACTDKQKKHRVKASGNLQYVPNSIHDVLSVGFIYNRVKRKTTFVPFRAKSINDLLFPWVLRSVYEKIICICTYSS